MTWTLAARKRLLANDQDFYDQYCEPETLKRLFAPNPLGGAESPLVGSLRRVVGRLTELMPNAVHTSAKWAPPEAVVTLGSFRNIRGAMKGESRVGIGQKDGGLYLLVAGQILHGHKNLVMDQSHPWSAWRQGEPDGPKHGTIWRCMTPIDLYDDAGPASGHPLHSSHTISRLLSTLGKATDAPKQGLYEQLTRAGVSLPAEVVAIYPAAYREWRTRMQTRRSGDK